MLQTIALHEPVTVSGLARICGQERNAVGLVVDALVAARLVYRARAADGSRIELRLTYAGAAVLGYR